MSLPQPLVSVIIPVYNSENFLAEAIQSIINQNYQNSEIIIVDDGSTDRTAEVAKQFQDIAHYIYQDNAGPSAARNRGIKIAKGEFITFLDADDLWVEGSLKNQIAYFQANPEVEIVQGNLQNLVVYLDPETKNIVKKFGKPRVSFNVGCAIYKKSVFDKIGGFNENLRHSEDVELLVRIKENNINWLLVDEVVLLYRRHKNSLMSQHEPTDLTPLHLVSWLRIIKQSLDRRREKDYLSN